MVTQMKIGRDIEVENCQKEFWNRFHRVERTRKTINKIAHQLTQEQVMKEMIQGQQARKPKSNRVRTYSSITVVKRLEANAKMTWPLLGSFLVPWPRPHKNENNISLQTNLSTKINSQVYAGGGGEGTMGGEAGRGRGHHSTSASGSPWIISHLGWRGR